MKYHRTQSHACSVDVVVIGAGHSGLAMSHFLSAQDIDHVVLERGEVANSWRHERWDSLHLLTPNWQSRLPGYAYAGDSPDDFMSMPEVIDFISGYAAVSGAPVQTQTEVQAVHRLQSGYRVNTNQGSWQARAVVVASGAFNIPKIPAVAASLPESIHQTTTRDYRKPGNLPEGGVLVVGASASGLQLADELHQSGRPVSIAVGEHVRMPRAYRGRDVQYWMDKVGLLDEGYESVDDIRRARHVPSPQLVGSKDHKTLDLNTLSKKGVQLFGKFVGVRDDKLQFSGSLRNVCALADLKMNRMLTTIDDWIECKGDTAAIGRAERLEPTLVSEKSSLSLDLRNDDIKSVVWATGYTPDYSWLKVPTLDRKGFIKHDGGVAEVEGLYVMGLPFLRRRKSSFIHGAEDDARDLSSHLRAYLDNQISTSFSRVGT